MDKQRMPKPGEIYHHFKDKPYQIMTVATHSETGEQLVVYQALYGDFKTYVRPLEMFISEVDTVKYPEVTQKYRFELRRNQEGSAETAEADSSSKSVETAVSGGPEQQKQEPELVRFSIESAPPVIGKDSDISTSDGTVNSILLAFLDAQSYNKKLEVITSNMKHMDDRLINDMAVALDCAVNDGPLDDRIKGLIYSLQTMCRFEDRRLR